MNRAPDNLPRTEDWQLSGACREVDPELWHPEGHSGRYAAQINHAKAICFGCPVLTACRDWALERREPFGIWGGMTEQERANWRRRIQRANTANEPQLVRIPVIVYGSHEQAYKAGTTVDGDHVVWVGGNEVKVDGRRWTPNQTAWWAAHETAPIGRVFTDCDRDGCVLHLTDQAVRDARQAAEKAAREAEREAAQAKRPTTTLDCGMASGHRGHLDRGEAPCAPCMDAYARTDWLLKSAATPERSVA